MVPASIRRAGSWVAPWLAAGCAAGFIDGIAGLLVNREIAGSFADRLTTLLVSGVLFSLVFAAIGLCVGAAVALFRRQRHPTRGAVRRRTVGASAGVVLAALLVAALGFGNERSVTTARPNIILISIDTLRADHLGVNGYPRNTSPNLDALAAEGVLFERAFAQSPWTLPSHASMLTGLTPVAHGAFELNGALSDAHETVAERLARRGYDTAAFVGGTPSSFIGSGRKLNQGFGFYEQYPHPRRGWGGVLARRIDHARLKWIDRHVGNAHAEIAAVARWMEHRANEPFFLFVHFFDVHSKTVRLPYEAPEPFRDRFCAHVDAAGFNGCTGAGHCASEYLHDLWSGAAPGPSPETVERLKCLYDGGIAFVDDELGRLFDHLRRLGLWQRTLIAVTADHGEAFFEHRVPDHTELYDEVLHVPLIMRGPGIPKGIRDAEYTRTVDIAPTLVALAGDAAPLGEGRCLFPLLADKPADDAHGEAADLAINKHRGDSVSLRQGGWKYVLHTPTEYPRVVLRPPEELFDLVHDPEERTNLIRAVPDDRVDALRGQLTQVRAQQEQLHARLVSGEGKVQVSLSADDVERMRQLGYAQ